MPVGVVADDALAEPEDLAHAEVVAQALPLTHFLRIVRGIVLRGAPIGDLGRPALKLLVFLVVVTIYVSLRMEIKMAVAALVAKGITVVAAAGNDGVRRLVPPGGDARMLLDIVEVGGDIDWLPMRSSGMSLVIRDITHRKLFEEELLHQATHDSLTGLPNRSLLFDRLAVCFARSKRRGGRTFGVLFIDLRDREGRTQTVFDPADLAKEVFEQATHLHAESVIQITGKVRVRPAGARSRCAPARRTTGRSRDRAAAAATRRRDVQPQDRQGRRANRLAQTCY